MKSDEVLKIQKRLKALGFDPGPIDGILGPMTRAALSSYKASQMSAPHLPEPPWIAEAKKAVNRHEVHDNEWLRDWLSSDGHTLGDPSKLPWCGDFVETAIRLSLPKEPIPDNPYWALNWLKFGIPCKPTYGAVAAISRNGGGHVMFIVGEDATRYYALGGNQSNKSSVVPVDKRRFKSSSFRWPSTYHVPLGNYLPRMNSAAAANTQEG